MSLFEVTEFDRKIYENELRDYLPDEMIDIHTHVWRGKVVLTPDYDKRQVVWPILVAAENTYEDIREAYRLFFPGKRVTPLIFASKVKNIGLVKERNDYIAEAMKALSCPGLYYCHPKQSSGEVEAEVLKHGFIGLKSYLTLSPSYIPEKEVRILDFFPPHILEVADKHGLIVMLHVPRPQRFRDPVNIAQIKYICEHYRGLKLIVAHVGRAYCRSDLGNAFSDIGFYDNLWYDFTANTNEEVFVELLKNYPLDRIMFGSDEPIVRMRMRRIDENGKYINLVPPGLYGDPAQDSHLREVTPEEAAKITFFMYEEILSMKRAQARLGLGDNVTEMLYFSNADKLIKSVTH